MKKIVLLVLMTLGILCFAAPACAEGLTIYGDYSRLAFDAAGPLYWGVDSFDNAALGAEYAGDAFVLGGFYSMAVGVDPEAPGHTLGETLWGVYGGWSFLHTETFRLTGLLGYLDWGWTLEDGSDPEDQTGFNGFAVGLKAEIEADPIAVSLLYLYGVYNGFTWNDFDGDPAFTDYGHTTLTYLELKATYMISRTVGVYAVYRSVFGDYDGPAPPWNQDASASGFGVGLQITF